MPRAVCRLSCGQLGDSLRRFRIIKFCNLFFSFCAQKPMHQYNYLFKLLTTGSSETAKFIKFKILLIDL